MASAEGVTSKEVLEAQAHLWSHIFSFINSFSLKTAIELGIPDAMHSFGRPISLSQLRGALSIPKSRTEHFQRFMRLLVHSGFIGRQNNQNDEEDEEDIYFLTTFSTLLIKEKGRDASPLLLVVLDEMLLRPWSKLSAWFKAEEPSTAFELEHGTPLWEATERWPEFGKLVKEGMRSDSESITEVVIRDCGEIFHGVKTLVEVAGGRSTMAKAITEAFPQIKCTVLDLPHMVVDVEKSRHVEVVAGNIFDCIPPADAVILKWVLHCWSDEECLTILKRCKEAIPPKEKGGKLIIIEKVMNTDIEHQKLVETQLHFDIHMMIHTTGKQRTERQWKKLFTNAGFKDYKIIPMLGLRSIIEVYY